MKRKTQWETFSTQQTKLQSKFCQTFNINICVALGWNSNCLPSNLAMLCLKHDLSKQKKPKNKYQHKYTFSNFIRYVLPLKIEGMTW